MLSIEKYKERELLLNDFDEDIPARMDTLAILNRLEKQNELQKAYAILNTYKISTIDFWEKYKYIMPATTGTTGILGIGGYVAFIIKSFIPSLTQELRNYIARYNNTIISALNTTCGSLIPLDLFHSEMAYFCARTMNFVDNIHPFTFAYNDDCINFKLREFCNWQDLGDTAFHCAVRINQLYTVSCNVNVAFPYVSNSRNIKMDMEALNKDCAGISPVPSITDLCSFPPYSHTPLKLRCGTLALDICNIVAQSSFNNTFPNQNYSCADKFISPEVFSACEEVASDIHNDTNWMFSLGLFITVTIGLFFFICGCAFFIVNGLSWINNKNHLNQLPKEDQDSFVQALEEYPAETHINEEMKVTYAIDLLDIAKNNIIKEKKYINDRRFCFLIGREDPDSFIPNNLPNDIAHKILYFSDLFLKPPVEMTSVECEKILSHNFLKMGC
jgi:hypothetical protein